MDRILSDKIPLWDLGVYGMIILKRFVESNTKSDQFSVEQIVGFYKHRVQKISLKFEELFHT